LDKNLLKKHEKTLLSAMGSVAHCKNLLTRLDRQWTRATLTGKINCSRIAQTLIDFIITTQDNFSSLQSTLVDTLVLESTQKVVLEISAVAQVAIDILKRNLFERTADVGFLATDDDLARFLLSGDDPEAVGLIEDRLREYRDKYTVYAEIIVLDAQGRVRAHLNRDNPVTRTSDPLLAAALASDTYVETYRESDLVPGGGDVLIYSQAVRHPYDGKALGVLCLVFDFAGEMAGIFENLAQSSEDIVIMILDESGTAIASSDPDKAPVGVAYDMALRDDFHLVQIAGEPYLAKTLPTNGYQGFFGLPWYGHVAKRVTTAFRNAEGGHGLDESAIRQNAIFSGRLVQVEEASENVLSDLELVVQNGEIMAAKKSLEADLSERVEAQALPHVLNEVKKIGDQVQHVFQTSTDGLLKLVTSSRLHDVRFLAQLAIGIMDRNLYERANDCRWWALTSDFRRFMDKPALEAAERDRMREILAYINSLYTVYANLFVYGRSGEILACSNPDENRHVGRTLDAPYVDQTLRLASSQHYCVSDFAPTDLYAVNGAKRPTYIYNAAITSLADPATALGGIGIVFDSEPQFLSMLRDCLPRDGQGHILDGSEGMFVEPGGRVIASTNPDIAPGDMADVSQAFRQLACGQFASHLEAEGDRLYAVGCAHCAGYREYKRDGVYVNDLLSIIRVRI
jgi:hypothetical protein